MFQAIGSRALGPHRSPATCGNQLPRPEPHGTTTCIHHGKPATATYQNHWQSWLPRIRRMHVGRHHDTLANTCTRPSAISLPHPRDSAECGEQQAYKSRSPASMPQRMPYQPTKQRHTVANNTNKPLTQRTEMAR